MSVCWIVVVLLLLQCSDEPGKPCKEKRDVDEQRDTRQTAQDASQSQVTRILKLLDPARFLIFITSLVLITHASWRAVKLDKEIKEDSTSEGVHNLSCFHVVCFPLMGSFWLLVFFYFFQYMMFVYIVLCTVLSVVAIFNLVYPAIKRLLIQRVTLAKWITAVISVSISILWVLTGHWICLDLLGAAICVMMIQFVRVPSLKLSAFLLLGLLVYDVFWVFYSASIFSANVMVEVATKQAVNPVAVVGHKLNLPEAVKSRPPLSIPGKLLVPSFTGNEGFAMLGLGDIVLPGLLLCFAMRFDRECAKSSGRGGSTHSLNHFLMNLVLFCQKCSYFSITLVGYAIGLFVATLVAELYRAAQPALLYLVPGVLLPLFVKALLQGDLSTMWSGPFAGSGSTTTVISSQKKGYQQIDKYSLLPI